MRRFFVFLLALLLGGVMPTGEEEQVLTYTRIVHGSPTETELSEDGFLRAVWISQFDMQPLYRDGNSQRDAEQFCELVAQMCETLKKDGFQTVFLQLRPNGDSMYESDLYPLSKYVAGAYGGDIAYDAVSLFVSIARSCGISVHGWINPLRLVTLAEMQSIPTGYAVRDWYDAGSGQVKEYGGRLYLDPSYPEVRELIASGAAEILERYGLDGIHMDDYFYPTTDVSFDSAEFAASGFDNLGDFRRNNINRLVALLYQTAHTYGKVFGISPAGNLDSLANGYYADAATWCSADGYIDYILPQLYYGFENQYCPYDVMVDRWAGLVTNEHVRLYIGLSAAKAVLASGGTMDTFAGTVRGRSEWICRKDILARSLDVLYADERVDGYCFFSYSSLYDLFTGEVTEGIAEEYERLGTLLQANR